MHVHLSSQHTTLPVCRTTTASCNLTPPIACNSVSLPTDGVNLLPMNGSSRVHVLQPPPPTWHSCSKFTAHEQLSTLVVCNHWVTLSTCTGDVIVDRCSFVSRGHPSTTQLYTSGWTCVKWTGGRVTSGGERWTHTKWKQKHSFSSTYRTLAFQHTHY